MLTRCPAAACCRRMILMATSLPGVGASESSAKMTCKEGCRLLGLSGGPVGGHVQQRRQHFERQRKHHLPPAPTREDTPSPSVDRYL